MEKKRWTITDLAGLLAFALFALCLLGVLLTGARSYGALVRRGEESFDRRTAAQYVATRVRQADSAGSICVESFGDCPALTVRQEIGGETYLTRIYCHDGWLRELFAASSAELAPEDGERVAEVPEMTFTLRENRLYVHMTLPEGETQRMTFCLRSGGEVMP